MRIRQIEKEPQFISQRVSQYFKRKHRAHVEMQQELDVAYLSISEAEIPVRQVWAINDIATPLEESRAILDEMGEQGVPRLLNLPVPNQFLMSALYRRVASEATAEFGRKFTSRNVKDCVQAWMNFERSFAVDQKD